MEPGSEYCMKTKVKWHTGRVEHKIFRYLTMNDISDCLQFDNSADLRRSIIVLVNASPDWDIKLNSDEIPDTFVREINTPRILGDSKFRSMSAEDYYETLDLGGDFKRLSLVGQLKTTQEVDHYHRSFNAFYKVNVMISEHMKKFGHFSR